VAAAPQTPATPTDPQEWQHYPVSENVAISRWPKIPSFAFRDTGSLPAPAMSELDWPQVQALSLAEEDRGLLRRGLPVRLPWPRSLSLETAQAGTVLPVPDESIFRIREGLRAASRGLTSPRRAEKTGLDHPPTSRHARHLPSTVGGKSGRTRQANVHQKGQAAHGRRGVIKHMVQVRKRSA
jgi:hypothetical protein